MTGINDINFFEEDFISKGFSYPKDYLHFIRSGCELQYPWWLLRKRPDFAIRCFELLNEDLGSEKLLIPFAKTDDGGDIACFDGDEKTGNPKVYFYAGEETLKNVNWSDRYFADSYNEFVSSIGG